MRALRSLALLLTLALGVSGCASFLPAETPEQKFYAAQGLYIVVAEQAVAYKESEGADPDVVRLIKVADLQAYEALQAGRALLAEAPSGERDANLVLYARIAQAAIGRLTAALEKETQ